METPQIRSVSLVAHPDVEHLQPQLEDFIQRGRAAMGPLWIRLTAMKMTLDAVATLKGGAEKEAVDRAALSLSPDLEVALLDAKQALIPDAAITPASPAIEEE